MSFYVYGHYQADTHTIFYVGKASRTRPRKPHSEETKQKIREALARRKADL